MKNKIVYIDGLEFVFFMLGYGLGGLGCGDKYGWLLVGLMLMIIVIYWIQVLRD